MIRTIESTPMRKKYLIATFAAIVLTLNACGKKAEAPTSQPAPAPTTATVPTPPPVMVGVTVNTITLGSAIGGDKKITRATDSFDKKDTIYASVDTAGAGSVKLKARWTYRKGGQESLVKEDSQTIAPTGLATSEFHISKPGGWPAGDYQVAISVDDKAASSKTFMVK